MTTATEKAPLEELLDQPMRAIRVAYILAYRDPHYIRTESLLAALADSPHVELLVARNAHRGIRRYIDTWVALRRVVALSPDIYLLGFRGHEFFPIARWLTRGKPLIFDALMSPYASLRHEHKDTSLKRLLATLIRPFESYALRHADLVLTDTELHAKFYSRSLKLSRTHFIAVPVGARESPTVYPATKPISTRVFSVLFYGSFLPLHGLGLVLQAAAALKHLPIRFDFIGGGRKWQKKLPRLCHELQVANFTHRLWVPFDDLIQVDIPSADLCLGGPFGGTPQAKRVVTTKASQCLALGKATVIGRIHEDYGFVHQANCLLVKQHDPAALAASIRWAFEHQAALSTIGANGRTLYVQRLSLSTVTAALAPALRELVSTQREECVS